MDEGQQLSDAAGAPEWMATTLPLEVEFECESTVRRVDELNGEQAQELARVALRHNFRLVNMLRQSIDRVAYLEEVIDDIIEQPTDQ